MQLLAEISFNQIINNDIIQNFYSYHWRIISVFLSEIDILKK